MLDKITLTNLNIRQSITILLAKLILLDFLMAFVVIGFYWSLLQDGGFIELALTNSNFFISIFGLIGLFKILLGIYIVLKWINEYYEITPEFIYHKRGIIFRNKEQYKLSNVRAMVLQDSFWGEIFNFGTITLYDMRLHKYLDMYLIHNPKRYADVLKELKPDIEIEKDNIYIPVILPGEKFEEQKIWGAT